MYFYYDGFCEFEVVIAASLFKGNYFTAALEKRIYVSEEKQKYMPDKTIGEINPEDIDLFIIPGGNPAYLYENNTLVELIKKLNYNNKIIAGICGGTFLMARCGVLKGKRCTGDSSGLISDANYIHLFDEAIIEQKDVVVDGNIVTSTGQSFIEFAFELSKIMNIYEHSTEAEEDYEWYKNIKRS